MYDVRQPQVSRLHYVDIWLATGVVSMLLLLESNHMLHRCMYRYAEDGWRQGLNTYDLTGLGKKASARFGEFCCCCCLPLLPQLNSFLAHPWIFFGDALLDVIKSCWFIIQAAG